VKRRHLVLTVSLPVVFAIAAAAMRAQSLSAQAEEKPGCNVRLKGLKTLSDPQQSLVNLHPKNTTVAAINSLPQPHPTPKTRSTDFSRRVWRVTAQITEFKAEGDSDIHIVLFDGGAYLIAEMPAAQCVPKKARDRLAIVAVRKKFETSCGEPTNHWQQLGAVVAINGVGFFDIPHTQKPHAANFAELHPVTGIKFLAGCHA
jgi:hypothetical protein